MNHLVAVILAWLSFDGGWPATDQRPAVVLSAPTVLAELRYGTDGQPGGRTVEAVYVDATRTIHLPATWDSRKVADVSLLVHEMVHHLQNLAGTRFPCPAAREVAAYEAQARWLALFGRSLQSEYGLDRATLRIITGCPPP